VPIRPEPAAPALGVARTCTLLIPGRKLVPTIIEVVIKLSLLAAVPSPEHIGVVSKLLPGATTLNVAAPPAGSTKISTSSRLVLAPPTPHSASNTIMMRAAALPARGMLNVVAPFIVMSCAAFIGVIVAELLVLKSTSDCALDATDKKVAARIGTNDRLRRRAVVEENLMMRSPIETSIARNVRSDTALSCQRSLWVVFLRGARSNVS
jgi:hypothetical protein